MLVFPIFKYMIKQDIVNIMDNGKKYVSSLHLKVKRGHTKINKTAKEPEMKKKIAVKIK